MNIELVKAINSGECIALIGAGLSYDYGFPTWKSLAEESIIFAKATLHDINYVHLSDLLARNKYSEIFSELLTHDPDQIYYNWLRSKFETTFQNKSGTAYEIISDWPFNIFLTTNFDHSLVNYLNSKGIPFIEKLNSKEDFDSLHLPLKNVIFKIHGDFTSPNSIVLTSEQYKAFCLDPKREYWRDKIRSALSFMNVVIMGYSVNDPDFNEQLTRAKDIAGPNHPIFMFTSGLSQKEINDLYCSKNIRVIPYENSDGTHTNLVKLLKQYSIFIAHRKSANIGLDDSQSKTVDLASNLFIFRQLRLINDGNEVLQNTYSSLLLNILFNNEKKHDWIELIQLENELRIKTHATIDIDPLCFRNSINKLYSTKMVEVTADQKRLRISSHGLSTLDAAFSRNKAINEIFAKKCELILKSLKSDLSSEKIQQIIDLIKHGLVKAFEKRGIELSRWAFTDNSLDLSDSTDILKIIKDQCNHLTDFEDRSLFIDLMINIFTQPSDEIKAYLALLSQGFFAYHSLGYQYDVLCERKRITENKIWILDSSIILPILALGCQDNSFALDLINQAKKLGCNLVTTNRLFQEVLGHLTWAKNTFEKKAPQSMDYVLVTKAQAGYKPNLFAEGYINWSATSGNPSFPEYISSCLYSYDNENLSQQLRRTIIEKYGIAILNTEEFTCYSDELLILRDNDYFENIKNKRIEFSTYKNDDQCIAEAEVQYVCEKQDAIFLSTSSVLNLISKKRKKIAWKPEIFYRFLSLFTDVPLNDENLFSSMLQDIKLLGLPIIDKVGIERFIQPSLRQSKLLLENEREEFIDALGLTEYTRYMDDYEKTPDDEKPFYTMQFAFYVAKKVEERSKQKDIELTKLKSEKLPEKDRKLLESTKRRLKERDRERLRKKRQIKSRKHNK